MDGLVSVEQKLRLLWRGHQHFDVQGGIDYGRETPLGAGDGIHDGLWDVSQVGWGEFPLAVPPPEKCSEWPFLNGGKALRVVRGTERA